MREFVIEPLVQTQAYRLPDSIKILMMLKSLTPSVALRQNRELSSGWRLFLAQIVSDR
jgi:hypothetical protein